MEQHVSRTILLWIAIPAAIYGLTVAMMVVPQIVRVVVPEVVRTIVR